MQIVRIYKYIKWYCPLQHYKDIYNERKHLLNELKLFLTHTLTLSFFHYVIMYICLLMLCVCHKKVNKVLWFKYWFHTGHVLILLFMHDYTCLYMLVIIDECLSDDFHSVWAKWTRGTGTLWLLYSYDPVLKYKLVTTHGNEFNKTDQTTYCKPLSKFYW